MKDPVFKGGKTYERAVIVKKLSENGNKDPFSGKVFPDDEVDCHTDMKADIKKFVIDQIPKIFMFLPKLM